MPSSRSPSPELNPLSLADNTDLIPLPNTKSAQTTSLTFQTLNPPDQPLLPPTKSLLLHEDLTSGCGGQLWPAGMVLSRFMLRYHGEDLKDEKILEIGSGGGLVGLAVAIGCAFQKPIYITDQENMFSLMERNISLNKLEDTVVPLVFDWGTPLPAQILPADQRPTVILAADCVYFEPAFPLLLQTLKDLLKPFSNPSEKEEVGEKDVVVRPRCYFCFKKRRRADMQFLKAAKKNFLVEEVEDEDRKVWEREGLFMFCLRSKEV